MKQATLAIGMLLITAFAVSSTPTAEALCYQDHVAYNGLRHACPNDENIPPRDLVPSVDCRVGLDSTGCTPGPGSDKNRIRANTTTPAGQAPDAVADTEETVAHSHEPCAALSAGMPARPSCHGPSETLYCGKPRSAYTTYSDYRNSITGVFVYPGAGTTSGPDIVLGSPHVDQIHTGDGDDCIYGGGSGDVLYGGSGNDVIHGEGGDDTIGGDSYSDHPARPSCRAGLVPGNNVLYGEDGDDTIAGCEGTDRLYGGPGGDTLMGFGGTDHLYGEDGVDHLWVEDEGDPAFQPGPPGNSGLFGGAGGDFLHGSLGNDRRLYGGDGDDFLYGYAGDDVLRGGPGYDIIYGGAGDFDEGYGGPGKGQCEDDVEFQTDC